MGAKDSAAVPVVPRPWAFRQVFRKLSWRSNVLPVAFCDRAPQWIPSISGEHPFHVRFKLCFADSKVRVVFLGLLKRYFVCTRLIPWIEQLHRVIFPETDVANCVAARALPEGLIAATWACELRTSSSHGLFIAQSGGLIQCERRPEPMCEPPVQKSAPAIYRTQRGNPSPFPLPIGWGEGKIPAGVLPRVAFVPHLPWATIMSSLRDFRLVATKSRVVAQRKLRGL
jgi:hypothetical protein